MGSKAAQGSTAPDDQSFRRIQVGVKTNRDDVVFDFDTSELATETFDDLRKNTMRSRSVQARGQAGRSDAFVRYDRIKWNRNFEATALRDGKVRDVLR